MKTIILCGGRGTRMSEQTDSIPKALVKVHGKPIIWHIMKHYASFGYNEFILALGYKGEMIKDYFLNYELHNHDFTLDEGIILNHEISNEKFVITFCNTGENSLPGERILRCKKYVESRQFMVTYCDGVSDVNINELLSFHGEQGKIGTITVVHPHSKFGSVTVNLNSVMEFKEKPVLDSYINGGYMVFNTEVFKYIKPASPNEPNEPGEMEHEMLKRLIDIKQLQGYEHDGFWFAVDTQKELEELNKIYMERK